MKKSWREYKNDLYSWTARPDVREYVAQAHSAFKAAQDFGVLKAIPVVAEIGAAVGIANRLINAESASSDPDDQLGVLAVRCGFTKHYLPGMGQLLDTVQAFEPRKVLGRGGQYVLLEADCGKGSVASVIQLGDQRSAHDLYVYLKGCDVTDVRKLIWDKVGGVLNVEAQSTRNYSSFAINLSARDVPESYLAGRISPEALARNVQRLRAANVSPAYRLDGPPGTGKTTLTMKVAEALGDSAVVIAPTVLSESNKLSYLSTFLTALNPGVIVLDDIDSANTPRAFLGFVSGLRRKMPSTALFSTVNDPSRLPDALTRPGRLGRRLVVPGPTDAEREALIRMYTAKLGVKRDLSALSEHMKHPLFTHDYVKDCVEQALILDDAQLLRYVKETIKYLSRTDPRSVESEEVDDDE